MKPLDARDEQYTLIDMDGYICLFTNMRLDRDTIPEGLYCYDVRDADANGEFAEVQKFVLVNHWGTIITKEPLPLDPQWNSYFPERDAEYFTGESFSLVQFQTISNEELLAMVKTPSLAAQVQNAQERSNLNRKNETKVAREDLTRK